MNPARSFSPALIGGHYQSLWVYILGPTAGAIVAVFVFMVLHEKLEKN
jgi:aquaporin Z